MQGFVSIVLAVNQMRGFSDNIVEQMVVANVLRSLTPRFDYISSYWSIQGLNQVDNEWVKWILVGACSKDQPVCYKRYQRALLVKGKASNAKDADKDVV